MAQINPATVSAGNQKIANKYAAPTRLRIAHRIVLLLALATLAVSMLSGQSMTLDILATILFTAAIILRLTLVCGVSAKQEIA